MLLASMISRGCPLQNMHTINWSPVLPKLEKILYCFASYKYPGFRVPSLFRPLRREFPPEIALRPVPAVFEKFGGRGHKVSFKKPKNHSNRGETI